MSYPQAIPSRLDAQWGVEPLAEHRIPLFGDALMSLVYRSRNLERRNAIACATLDRCVENVIGPGISLRPNSTSEKWNAAIKRLLKRYTTGKLLDARGMLTWLGIQKGIFRGVMRDGDVGILLVDEGNGPKVQIIDSTAIATPTSGEAGSRTIRDGVELDAGGRPIAYWIRVNDSQGIESFKRVEARDLIFYHRSPRTDVIRGESAFNGGFRVFEQLEGFIEAVVVGIRANANICLIRKRRRKKGNGPLDKNKSTETGRGEAAPAADLEPGTVVEVDVDEDDDLTSFMPSQPGQSFADTVRAFGRFCGLKFGLTVQRILLDFTATNYSVSRSTALQEQRFAEPEQADFVEAVLRRLYQWLVSKWNKMGLIVDEDGNKIEEPPDSWSFEWIPPARPLTEPAKDAPGMKLMVGMNVESYRNIAEANGYDLDQIIIDNERDVKRMREAGIAPEGFLEAMAGKPPADDPENEDDRPEDREDDDSIDRDQIEAYGVAVRSGAITPQTEDERRFRRGMRLPEMGKEALAAWEADKGVRRPVTLAKDASGGGTPFSTGTAIGLADDPEQEEDDEQQTDE